MYLTQVWIFFIFWVCPWGMVTQRQVSSGQEFSMETDTVFMEHFPMTLRTSDHDEHTTPPRVTLTLSSAKINFTIPRMVHGYTLDSCHAVAEWPWIDRLKGLEYFTFHWNKQFTSKVSVYLMEQQDVWTDLREWHGKTLDIHVTCTTVPPAHQILEGSIRVTFEVEKSVPLFQKSIIQSEAWETQSVVSKESHSASKFTFIPIPSTGFLDSKTVVGHVFKKDYLTQPYIFHRGQFSPELVIGEVPITLSDEDLVSSSPNPLEKRVTVELSSRRFNVHLFMTSFVSLHAVTLKACQGTGTTLTSTRSSLFQLTCEDGCKHPLSVSLKNTKPKNMAFVLTCQFENQEQEQRGNLPLFPEATFRMVLEMKKKGSTPMSEDSDRSSRDGGNVFKKEETSETIDKRLSPTPQSFPLLDLTEKKLATITKVTSIGNVQAPSSSTYFFVIQNDFVKVSTGTSVRANAPPRAKTSEAIKLYLQHDPTTTEVSSTSHLTCSGKGYLPGYAVLFTFLCVDGCQGPISLKWMGTSAEWAPSASNFNDFASLFGIVLRCAFHDGSNWIVGQDFSIVWTFESQPKPNTEKKSENEKENNRKNNKKKKRKTN